MSIIEDALKADRIILHTTGWHAGEPPEVFIPRKQSDIHKLQYTYWYSRSQPSEAQDFCGGSKRLGVNTYVWFYEREPKSRRKDRHAGEDTKTDGYMTHFCVGDRDSGAFEPIDVEMGVACRKKRPSDAVTVWKHSATHRRTALADRIGGGGGQANRSKKGGGTERCMRKRFK